MTGTQAAFVVFLTVVKRIRIVQNGTYMCISSNANTVGIGI
jgi:hypothetical protein